ncbi:MAG: heme-degrading domain-containing protein [Syntrophobacterales bacterium]|nr:MAG: heme-degrading domain-containing protein [Syntrophobacterales bacterium]
MKKHVCIAMVLVIGLVAGGIAYAASDQEKLDAIAKQEAELIFDKFDHEDALQLGLLMVKRAKEQKLPICIDIAMNGQQLFRVALPGTSGDNDYWVKRKNYIVNRFHMSSLRTFFWNKVNDWPSVFDMDFYTMFGVNTMEGVAIGGAFPLKVKGAGCVGTVTVSGIPHELDHKHAVDCIREYLGK